MKNIYVITSVSTIIIMASIVILVIVILYYSFMIQELVIMPIDLLNDMLLLLDSNDTNFVL